MRSSPSGHRLPAWGGPHPRPLPPGEENASCSLAPREQTARVSLVSPRPGLGEGPGVRASKPPGVRACKPPGVGAFVSPSTQGRGRELGN